MCTGRVDLAHVLRAYQKGADGVIIGGCWPGECHYVTEGNYHAMSVVHLGRKLLQEVGLSPDRLNIEWIAASEGARFANVMTEFVERVKGIGPLGQEGGPDPRLQERLDHLSELVPYIKLVERELLRAPSRVEQEIKDFWASEETDQIFQELIADKVALPTPAPIAAPCQIGCPIGTEAWRYVAHIANGDYERAYHAIREANPLPSVCARVCDHKCEQHCRHVASGQQPVAIRALKRFVTDTIDPATYVPERKAPRKERVAVVGAGPAGLSAAHMLSLSGYQVTLYDENDKPGGMLRLGIPSYRLPRDVLDREIDALIDDNITLKMGVTLGEQITVDQLFGDGFDAVFVAIGSMKSMPLRIEGEEADGVYPSLSFLRAFNLRDNSLARGRVGVIGGGNSAIDAARIALRQAGVEEVTIIYRRTREEMPAFAAEIDDAVEEGVKLQTLRTPVGVKTENGALVGLTCVRNELGEPDKSGRRRPLPVQGSEHLVPLDTLVVAVGEKPQIEAVEGPGIETTRWGSLAASPRTHLTSRPGLFAGGDVVTGPNTVVNAIAAGKKAAVMIDRYLNKEQLQQPGDGARPTLLPVPGPPTVDVPGARLAERLRASHLAATERCTTYAEVEQVVSEEVAQREARRCLRCDLDLCGTS